MPRFQILRWNLTSCLRFKDGRMQDGHSVWNFTRSSWSGALLLAPPPTGQLDTGPVAKRKQIQSSEKLRMSFETNETRELPRNPTRFVFVLSDVGDEIMSTFRREFPLTELPFPGSPGGCPGAESRVRDRFHTHRILLQNHPRSIFKEPLVRWVRRKPKICQLYTSICIIWAASSKFLNDFWLVWF